MENKTEKTQEIQNNTPKVDKGKKYHKQLNRTEEMVISDPQGYEIHEISKMSRLIDEFVTFGKKKNTIWTFTDVDVTEAKRKIAEYRKNTGNPLSFTAFIITIFAHCVANHKYPVNSLMKKNKQIYVFNDVDVSTNIERTLPNGKKKPTSYTIRKAQNKSLLEINQELIEAKKLKKLSVSGGKKKGILKKLTSNIHKYPKFIRKALLKMMFSSPKMKKGAMGTVNVTAVGMFGSGKGHMIHLTPHTASLGVGGMDVLPFNVEGKVINRDMLAITLAIDHSIVDGGPAARFFHDLRQWIMYFCHDAEWCFKSLPYEFK